MIVFVQCFVASMLGSVVGICAASIWALKQNKKWMDKNK